jgi:hypothetical protein
VATAADLLDDLKSRFDADPSKLLRSLDGAHKLAVARSRVHRGRVTVGPVTGAAEYPLPDVLAARYVMVGGYIWTRADESDIPALTAGDESVLGPGGVFAPGVDGRGRADPAVSRRRPTRPRRSRSSGRCGRRR